MGPPRCQRYYKIISDKTTNSFSRENKGPIEHNESKK